ncbi:MAG: hypothetical protein E6R04_03110 [Spirochaetes bacterium]|nr:MAG: hypothetical protein E6R04_03110 [Spirochaetota bacterium]
MNTAIRLSTRRLAAAVVAAIAVLLGVGSTISAPSASAAPRTTLSSYLVPGSQLTIYHSDGSSSDCTAGPGVSFGEKRRGIITSGHCGEDGDKVYWVDDNGREHRVGDLFRPIDKMVNFVQYDFALVPVDSAMIDTPVAGKYNPTTYITGAEIANIVKSGSTIHLCSYGITSGERCGDPIIENTYGSYPRITSTFRSDHGDSGGPVYAKRTDGSAAIVGVLRGQENSTMNSVIVPIEPALDMYNVKLSISRR